MITIDEAIQKLTRPRTKTEILKEYILDKKERFLDLFVFYLLNPYGVKPEGLCPVQSEFYLPISNEYCYFRSRGTSWSLTIYASKKDWYKKKKLFHYIEKDFIQWPIAGYISKRKAIFFANKAIKKYLKQK